MEQYAQALKKIDVSGSFDLSFFPEKGCLNIADTMDTERFLQATWAICIAFRPDRMDALFNGPDALKKILADMDNLQKKLARLFKENSKSKKHESEIVVEGIRMNLTAVEKQKKVGFVMILNPAP